MQDMNLTHRCPQPKACHMGTPQLFVATPIMNSWNVLCLNNSSLSFQTQASAQGLGILFPLGKAFAF